MSSAGNSRVVVEADGGSRGNPGPAGYGAVVLDADTDAVLAERKDAIGVDTNNVAEYRGLIAGLQAAAELGATSVLVRMDSKLVVEQMSGRWQVKHPSMRPLAREATALRARFEDVRFEWIPRERNKRADRLANEAMDEAAGKRRPAAAEPDSSRVSTAEEVSAARPDSTGWSQPTQPPTRLILLRHGSTAHTAERRFSGHNDLPLTTEGRAQAEALGRRAASFSPVAAVVSSPILRARQTADVVASSLGLPVAVDDGLAEVDFGAWEGLTFAELQQRHAAALSAWLASPEVAPPGGESFAAAARRTRRARDRLVAAYPGRTVVVVSHVSPIKLLLCSALQAPLDAIYRLYLDAASVSTVDLYADGNASVRLVNDTSHLT